MKQIIDSILESYGKLEPFIPVNPRYQPNGSEIVEFIDKLRSLLFPGYFEKKDIYKLLEAAGRLLNKQLLRLLNHKQEHKKDYIKKESARIINEFFAKFPKIIASLATDIEATFSGDPAAVDKNEIIICYPGIYAISVYRLAHELYLLGVPMLPRIMTEHAHSITGIDIHPGAKIGNYLCIDHGTGIVIGETTIIGENVKIYQGVTLGSLSTRGGQELRGQKRHPTVEDRVTIYSGASIFGGDTVIGEGSILGSNVFITSSVLPGSKLSINDEPWRK